jgi:acyl dehydratase
MSRIAQDANPAAALASHTPPETIGDFCTRSVSFSLSSIAEFARLTGDRNPLHLDTEAATQALHGRIIASGQQTTSQMIGLVATHFSRRCERFSRELLCLNFNFAFKAPVFADEPVTLRWTVSDLTWQPRLQGWVVLTDGQAESSGRLCVVGRGSLLVKGRPAASTSTETSKP